MPRFKTAEPVGTQQPPLMRRSARDLRKWLADFEKADRHTADEVEELCLRVRDPSMWHPLRRAACIRAMRALSAEPQHARHAGEVLLEVLDSTRLDQSGRLIRWLLRSAAITLGLVATMVLGMSNEDGLPNMWYVLGTVPEFMLVSVVLMLPISNAFEAAGLSRARSEAALSLGWLARREAAAGLCRAALGRSQVVAASARWVLPAVLAKVTDEQYGTFGRTVPDLVRLLRVRAQDADTDLRLAVVRALGAAGDGRAVEPLERMLADVAKDRARMLSDVMKDRTRRPDFSMDRLAEAISAALPVLRHRRELERRSERLLRPASAPGSPADVLVRPAQPGNQTDPSMLVRAVGADSDEEIQVDGVHRDGAAIETTVEVNQRPQTG